MMILSLIKRVMLRALCGVKQVNRRNVTDVSGRMIIGCVGKKLYYGGKVLC